MTTVRQQLEGELPPHNNVHPIPIDAPPEVRRASDELAAAVARHQTAGVALDTAEETARQAHTADAAALNHAVASDKTPPKPTAPKAADDLDTAKRVFEAAHRQVRSAQTALLAAIEVTRADWLPALIDDVTEREASIDRAFVNLHREIKALNLARSMVEEIRTAPGPREAIVRHGQAAFGPSPRALERGDDSEIAQLLVELRAKLDGDAPNWQARKDAAAATAERLAETAARASW